jgi:putative tricarboxylic transport membrane protein
MAILLGAFLVHGLEPGPRMLSDRLDITFSLVWTLAIANVVGGLLLMAWGNQVAKFTFLPGHYLVPAIVLFVFMGAWLSGGGLGDWISLMLFGLLGWVMKLSGWARPPLVLGYILGGIMEDGLHIGSQTHGWGFLTQPIVLVLAALIVFTIYLSWQRSVKQRDGGVKRQKVGDAADADSPRIAFAYSLLALVLFVFAAVEAAGWRADARLFPMIASLSAIPFVLVAVVRDWRAMRVRTEPSVERMTALYRGVSFSVWTLGIIGAALLIGQYLALVAFALLYLRFWGKASWGVSVAYAVGSAAVLYALFNLVVPVLWYESPFFSLFS